MIKTIDLQDYPILVYLNFELSPVGTPPFAVLQYPPSLMYLGTSDITILRYIPGYKTVRAGLRTIWWRLRFPGAEATRGLEPKGLQSSPWPVSQASPLPLALCARPPCWVSSKSLPSTSSSACPSQNRLGSSSPLPLLVGATERGS